jgi:hypothetical protein
MDDHDPGGAPPAPQDTGITLTLTPGEAKLVRTALRLLHDDYTRRDHMHAAIRAILARLPAEPDSPAPLPPDYRAPE